MKTQKHQMLLISSFRYALGRRTYIVSQIVEYLKEDWEVLSEWQQKQIKGDIEHAIEHDIAGDPCDIEHWKKVLEY